MKLSSLIIFIVLATIPFTIDGIRFKEPKGFLKLKELRRSASKINRVVGGEPAEEGFAPYQISLQNAASKIHSCGGSILNKNWILTAAHCVLGVEPKKLVVATGTIRWKEPDALYFVDQVHVHCNYNRPNYSNDIALLHLNRSIEFNERTKAVLLPTKQLKDGEPLILTGWGFTELRDGSPEELQKITLNFVEYKRCKKMLNDDTDLDIGHICTFTRAGEGACHGDSGSPLVNMNGEVEGVVNWGYPCATGVPDAFANVLYYRGWIRNVQSGNTKC